MVGSDHDDQRRAELRIGGWLPPALEPSGPADERDRPGHDPHRTVRRTDPPAQVAPAAIPVERPAQSPAVDHHARPESPVRHGRRHRRAILLVAVATLSASAGVPVLFHPSLDGSPREHEFDPPPVLLLESSPPVAPRPAESPAPTETVQASSSSGPPTATTGPDPVTAPADQPLLGTPSPPPASATPGPNSVEAEGPLAVRSGLAVPRPLVGASAGMVVASIGNGTANAVRFPALLVPASGDYTVTFFYAAAERRRATVTVNGRSATLRFPASGNGGTAIGSLTVRVTLTTGLNTIEYGHQRDWAPDLDRIVISP